jgi:phosphoglucomutase
MTPTPAISRAIVAYNRNHKQHLADGIVITPSHNPPEDGGLKYNPPSGGPADTNVTHRLETRANEFLRTGNVAVRRLPFNKALKTATTHQEHLMLPYVRDQKNVLDMEAIRSERLHVAVDPLGGAAREPPVRAKIRVSTIAS